jgi:hypothetical protein
LAIEPSERLHGVIAEQDPQCQAQRAGVGLRRRTGGERWLWVVFDDQLQRLRQLATVTRSVRARAMSIPTETPAPLM